MNYPRLYSMSTVCLLKHYNQDYLLHSLRTDFTGSNGVGKSIIADLFQIVFIADNKHIKFATEGIGKKDRKIETLPYQSGIGYVFFNVEVSEGKYIIIGAAIFSQGANLIKPFIITSSIDYNNSNIDQNNFASDKLLFCNDFLKGNGEAFTLDDLARIAPEKHQLYVHYFNSKEERIAYYDWLYRNELISINLVKEGNLKAFAKVIQSFSKSKSLDIDNSNSLIEYLFEENESEIENEYKQQEQAVQKLLHQFKTTKDNISDIAHKQKSLALLKEYEGNKRESEFNLLSHEYILKYKKKIDKTSALKKLNADVDQKRKRLIVISERKEQFSTITKRSSEKAVNETKAHDELINNRALFDALESNKKEQGILKSIDTVGLIHNAESNQKEALLEKDAQSYADTISNSKVVLKSYSSINAIEKKKAEQDKWLKEKINWIEQKESQLNQFKSILDKVDENSFFIKILSSKAMLNDSQQAILFYLRNLFYGKPMLIKDGIRYTESLNLLSENNITEDKVSNGWWLTIGEISEFISNQSSILPALSKTQIKNTDQLKEKIIQEITKCINQKSIYEDLSKGIKPEGFNDYDFDISLSDHTKITQHKRAAESCGLLKQKLLLLNDQQVKLLKDMAGLKTLYGISIEDTEFDSLIKKIGERKGIFTKRVEHLKAKFEGEQSEAKAINDNLPLIEENLTRLSKEAEEVENDFNTIETSFKIKYPDASIPNIDIDFSSLADIEPLRSAFDNSYQTYIGEYNQLVGHYEETKEHRNILINEQVNNHNYSYELLEQALLGRKIKALDNVTEHLEALNNDLLTIADELLKSLTKVFGKTENYYDRYKTLVQSLNDFFKGRLISNRFYFKIDFNPSPKLDIKWIEQLRKSANTIATATGTEAELTPEGFIEDFYIRYSGNKAKIPIEHLLNPKRYFVLRGKLTDEKGSEIPGSTGESYTAVALLGIARLSVVQDGNRKGLRFIILEESATLDNVNFGIFPVIAEEYGYQIITMTPKPYALGGDEGWYIHHLLPGKINRDINYPKVMSYFRTTKEKIELNAYLKSRNNELANF